MSRSVAPHGGYRRLVPEPTTAWYRRGVRPYRPRSPGRPAARLARRARTPADGWAAPLAAAVTGLAIAGVLLGRVSFTGAGAPALVSVTADTSTSGDVPVRPLTERDVRALLDHVRAPHVAAASAVLAGTVAASAAGEHTDAALLGVAADHLDLVGLRTVAGGWFVRDDFHGVQREAVIGPGVVEALWGSRTAPASVIGAELVLGRTAFRVRGVLAEGGREDDGSSADDAVLVPLETARGLLLAADGQVDRIVVAPTRPDAVEPAATEVTDVLDDAGPVEVSITS